MNRSVLVTLILFQYFAFAGAAKQRVTSNFFEPPFSLTCEQMNGLYPDNHKFTLKLASDKSFSLVDEPAFDTGAVFDTIEHYGLARIVSYAPYKRPNLRIELLANGYRTLKSATGGNTPAEKFDLPRSLGIVNYRDEPNWQGSFVQVWVNPEAESPLVSTREFDNLLCDLQLP